MIGSINIHCPPMPVLNTGWFPHSDREAQELPCTGFVTMPDTSQRPFIGFRFPKCRVRFVSLGKWMVDPVTAFGELEGGGRIEIAYPEEPVLRDGKYMMAQPIDNYADRSFVRILGGKTGTIRAPLPLARGVPGALFGLFRFTVEAVTIKGEVAWTG